jgi:hypothetical protein
MSVGHIDAVRIVSWGGTGANPNDNGDGTAVTISLDLNDDNVADRIDLDEDGQADVVRISVQNATATYFQNADFVF